MPHMTMADFRKVQDALSPLADDAKRTIAIAILTSAADHMADPALRDAAHEAYGTDEVEIDDEAATSPADDGTWVAAWVWMANEADDDEEEPECPHCAEPYSLDWTLATVQACPNCNGLVEQPA